MRKVKVLGMLVILIAAVACSKDKDNPVDNRIDVSLYHEKTKDRLGLLNKDIKLGITAEGEKSQEKKKTYLDTSKYQALSVQEAKALFIKISEENDLRGKIKPGYTTLIRGFHDFNYNGQIVCSLITEKREVVLKAESGDYRRFSQTEAGEFVSLENEQACMQMMGHYQAEIIVEKKVPYSTESLQDDNTEVVGGKYYKVDERTLLLVTPHEVAVFAVNKDGTPLVEFLEIENGKVVSLYGEIVVEDTDLMELDGTQAAVVRETKCDFSTLPPEFGSEEGEADSICYSPTGEREVINAKKYLGL